MKTKNYLIILLISMMGIVQYTQSQNPGWILPPIYKDNGLISLPTNHDYYGNTATSASNMQLDADNNITPSSIILRKQSLEGWFGKIIT